MHNSSVRLRCSTAASASTGREESHTKSSLTTEKDLDKLADMVRESGAGRKLGKPGQKIALWYYRMATNSLSEPRPL